MVTNPICIVAICKDCRKAVMFRYLKSSSVKLYNNISMGSGVMFITSGTPLHSSMTYKPDVEWCDCGSDEPRHLCRITDEELPGLEGKCEKCDYRFSCASSRIEIIYDGIK